MTHRAMTAARWAAAFDFDGRHALVTGATRGAGRAVAVAMAAAGATVLACHDTDDEDARSLAREFEETGGGNRLVRADLTRRDGLVATVEACREYLSTVHIVVTTGTPDGTEIAAPDGLLRPLLPAGASVVTISRDVTGSDGLSGRTRSLARSLGPDGVRVNLVAAGRAADARAEHVAALAVFLASAQAAGITGETVVATGGG